MLRSKKGSYERTIHLSQCPFFALASPCWLSVTRSDYAERRLDLNDLVVPHPLSTYFMQVEGDSMMNACIFHDDVIVVDRAITATHNKIVVAKLGEEFTLKRLQIMKGGKRIFLKSENPNYALLEVTGRQDFELWGVVTWAVHRLAGPRPKRT